MSIFSSIGNAIKSAATYTYNTVKSIGSAIGSAFSGGSSQSANALDFNNPVNKTLQSTRQNSPSYGTPAYYNTSNTYNAAIGSNNAGSIQTQGAAPSGYQLPVTISSGKQPFSFGGGSSSGNGSSGGFSSTPYATIQTQPRTISKNSGSTGVSTDGLTASKSSISSSGLSSPLSSATIGSGATPISLASAPTGTNPGTINTTGLASTTAGLYQRKPDGTFEPVKDDTKENTRKDIIREEADAYKAVFGEPKSVYDDPEVIQARQQRQQIQQALQAPTAELNAIVAKQNQDLLQLRQTGSQEGVTEAVYGGQANAINYNAAIRALPLQASIASLQGDLKLAQDYLSELTQIKSEQIKSQYEYNKGLFQSIEGALDKADQRQYEEMKTANDRAYKEEQDKIDAIDSWSKLAIQNGQPNLVKSLNNLDTSSSTFRQDLGKIASRIEAKTDSQIIGSPTTGYYNVIKDAQGNITATVPINTPRSETTGSDIVLTEEQKSDPFIKKLIATQGGKPITDTFAQQLNKGLTVLGQIGTLQSTIKDVKTGPIVGAFRGNNPWDTNAQVIKAQLNAIVPNLARGVYGEVGVLTDNDIKQYSKTLPNLKSTEDIRNAVLGITVDIIGKSIKRNLEINAANQKDVSGFIDIYTEMEKTKNSIFSQIPGYKPPVSAANNPFRQTVNIQNSSIISPTGGYKIPTN